MSRMKDHMNEQAEILFDSLHLLMKAEALIMLLHYKRFPSKLATLSATARTNVEAALTTVLEQAPEVTEAMCDMYYDLPTLAVASELWQDFLQVLNVLMQEVGYSDEYIVGLARRLNALNPDYVNQYAPSNDTPDTPYNKIVED